MQKISLYQQLSDLFQVMEYNKEEIETLINRICNLSFAQFIQKADKTFSLKEKEDFKNIVISDIQNDTQQKWVKFWGNDTYKNLFLPELEKNINDVLIVIFDNSSPEEQEILKKKLAEILS